MFARKKKVPEKEKEKLCPECYYKAVEDKYKVYNFAIIGLLVALLIFGLILPKFAFVRVTIVIVFLILSGIIILTIRIAASKELNSAREIYNKAMRSLRKEKESLKKKQKMYIIPSRSISQGPTALFCGFCGAPLTKFTDSCEYCGTHWVWENP